MKGGQIHVYLFIYWESVGSPTLCGCYWSILHTNYCIAPQQFHTIFQWQWLLCCSFTRSCWWEKGQVDMCPLDCQGASMKLGCFGCPHCESWPAGATFPPIYRGCDVFLSRPHLSHSDCRHQPHQPVKEKVGKNNWCTDGCDWKLYIPN